jgi:hypothetical protein
MYWQRTWFAAPRLLSGAGFHFPLREIFKPRQGAITKADLMEAAGCNLKAYMLAELH